MYAVTVTFQIKPEAMADFLPAMIENARQSLENEPGCHVFDICHEGATVFLYELYTDRAAFDAHLQTPHFQSFDAQVADMVTGKDVACFAQVIR